MRLRCLSFSFYSGRYWAKGFRFIPFFVTCIGFMEGGFNLLTHVLLPRAFLDRMDKGDGRMLDYVMGTCRSGNGRR
jgi:hypothetical protein